MLDRIGTDGAGPCPPAVTESRKAGLLPRKPTDHVTKHLQQGIESDHPRVNRGPCRKRASFARFTCQSTRSNGCLQPARPGRQGANVIKFSLRCHAWFHAPPFRQRARIL